MPCNCDHMHPSDRERELSRIACLLDELDGKPINPAHWNGNHPSIYWKALSDEEANALIAKLCSRLQEVDVTKYSLEMQLWWRDHQAIDKARLDKS